MRTLLATTALVGMAAAAQAAGANNSLYIDAGTSGFVGSLAITQDTTNHNNIISKDGSTGTSNNAYSAAGHWTSIAIGQTAGAGGGRNVLKGTANGLSSGASTSSLTATYATHTTGTGGNTHDLNATASGAVNIWVSVTNNGSSANSLTDNLTVSNGTSANGTVNYQLGVTGTGNTITNTIGGNALVIASGSSAGWDSGGANKATVTGDSNQVYNVITAGAGAVGLGLSINGSSNTVSHQSAATSTADGSTTYGTTNANVTSDVTVTGDNNTIKLASASGGARTSTVSVNAYSSNVVMDSGTNTSATTASVTIAGGGNSKVDFRLNQNNNGIDNATVILDSVKGATANDLNGTAYVLVDQGTGTGTKTATVYVTGVGYTMGPSDYASSVYTGGIDSLGASPGKYAVVVTQGSGGAYANVRTRANSNGATVFVSQ